MRQTICKIIEWSTAGPGCIKENPDFYSHVFCGQKDQLKTLLKSQWFDFLVVDFRGNGSDLKEALKVFKLLKSYERPEIILFCGSSEEEVQEKVPELAEVPWRAFSTSKNGGDSLGTIRELCEQKQSYFSQLSALYSPATKPRRKMRILEQLDAVYGVSLMYVLGLVSAERQSGIFNIYGGKSRISSVYFKRGLLTHIVTAHKSHLIGQILLELDFLNAADAENLAPSLGSKKIGQKLLEMGLVDDEQIRRAMEIQTVIRLSELFSSNRLLMNFTATDDTIDELRVDPSLFFSASLATIFTEISRQEILHFLENFRLCRFVVGTNLIENLPPVIREKIAQCANLAELVAERKLVVDVLEDMEVTDDFLHGLFFMAVHGMIAFEEALSVGNASRFFNYFEASLARISEEDLAANFGRLTGVKEIDNLSRGDLVRSAESFMGGMKGDFERLVESIGETDWMKENFVLAGRISEKIDLKAKWVSDLFCSEDRFAEFRVSTKAFLRKSLGIALEAEMNLEREYIGENFEYVEKETASFTDSHFRKTKFLYYFLISRFANRLRRQESLSEDEKETYAGLFSLIPIRELFSSERRLLYLLWFQLIGQPEKSRSEFQRINVFDPLFFSQRSKTKQIIIEAFRAREK